MTYSLKTAIRIVSEEDRQELIPFFEHIKSDCNEIFRWDMNNIKIGDIWYIDEGGCMDWHNTNVGTLSDYTILEGIPQDWREEMKTKGQQFVDNVIKHFNETPIEQIKEDWEKVVKDKDLQSKIDKLESENKELRECLNYFYIFGSLDSLSPSEDIKMRNQAKQLLK